MEFSKERVDYPQLVFIQLDRINAIMSNPHIVYTQLGRAVDALAAICSPLGDFEFSSKELPNNDNGKYEKIISTLESIMKELHRMGLLVRLKTAGRVTGGAETPKID